MADFTDWYNDTRKTLKKPITQQSLDYIRDIVLGNIKPVPQKVRSRVQFIETDGGNLIAWARGNRIYHMLSPNSGEILVRGEENWPRGMTRRYDQMTKILDARINGDDDSREIDRFLREGPIARQREEDRKRAERRMNRKIRLKKK